MIIAALPDNEEARLLDLASYDILDTKAENEFDELVELAGQICGCPISLITLLDKDRQWFKARRGIEEPETPRDIAFCTHTILQDEVMVVEDTTLDERFANNPFVTGDAHVRFYAGTPIVSPAGHKLGTLCIIDSKPKTLSKHEERVLVLLSNQVTKLLELRRKNILIRQRAEEIIAIKSNAINRVIKGQEEDKRKIAYNLHEDLAQGIASTILYLDMAEEETAAQRMALIKTARGQLHDLLVSTRKLSYAITPPAIHLVTAEELILEFADKIADTFPFLLEACIEKGQGNASAENALNAIRVIEQWLKMLSGKKQVSQVLLYIKVGEQFELHIEDDAPLVTISEREKEVFESLVHDRVQWQGGTVDLSVSPSGKNLLKVILPLAHS